MHITKRVYQWSESELKYCRQLGVHHIIAILPEELNKAPWEFLDLLELRKYVESFELKMAAIEAPPRSTVPLCLPVQTGTKRLPVSVSRSRTWPALASTRSAMTLPSIPAEGGGETG